MSAVYNPESETIAEIERLDLAAKRLRRLILNSRNEEDQRVLERQLRELKQEFSRLQSSLP